MGLLVALTVPISPALGQNVSVTDYSVPISRADNLRIDVLSLNYVTEGGEAVVQSGNLGVVYKKFYDSLPFAYSLDMIGATSFNKDNVQDKLVGNFTTSLVSRIKKYTPAEGNLFVFNDADFDYDVYLEEMQRTGQNMTRVFTFYREEATSIPDLGAMNTLAPASQASVMPWQRILGHGKAAENVHAGKHHACQPQPFGNRAARLGAGDERADDDYRGDRIGHRH